MRVIFILFTLQLVFQIDAAFSADVTRAFDSIASSRLKADQIFAKSGQVIFQERFNQRLEQWMLSIDMSRMSAPATPGLFCCFTMLKPHRRFA